MSINPLNLERQRSQSSITSSLDQQVQSAPAVIQVYRISGKVREAKYLKFPANIDKSKLIINLVQSLFKLKSER
jgi:hypothetical protein